MPPVVDETTPVKFLTKGYRGPHSGYDFRKYLPKDGQPGKWLPKVRGAVQACERGWHFTAVKDVEEWANARCYVVETEGEVLDAGNKLVASKMRLVAPVEAWSDQTLRLWTCDCAERVVHLTKDDRSTNAIRVARRFAFGLATKEELAAAGDAARAAAGDAARAAARAAAWAVAWAAARAAARAAAGAAARAAAWDAARHAEREWQRGRLLDYLNGRVDLAAIKASVEVLP